MNQPISCPTRQEYELLQGGALLSPVDVERLTAHLEQCDRCAALVDTLSGEDTDLHVLREARPTVSAVEPAAEFIADLCRLPLMADPSATRTENGTIVTSPAAEALDLLAPAQASGEIGRLGHYRVLRILGAGGMGVVFEAEDVQLKRRVALKGIRPVLAASAGAKRRFLREAQAVAALKHDHVVTIYQVGEDRGVPYLAMEYLEGESLSDRLDREGKLDTVEVVRIGTEVAEGLAAAHEKGLVHRDIKPANIWLEGQRRRTKILDFGLARGGDDDTHITAQGAIVGTPAYMSPEQTRGEELDSHADLFSLGCVLYRMCTGQAPFQGKDSMSTLLAVATYQPTPPRQVNPAVPAALSDLIMRLLNKDSAKRPASAQEVADALRQITTAPPPPAVAVRRPRWFVPAAAAVLLALLPLGYFFGGTVIRFATNKGEVIIETDDPDIVVTITQGKAEIHDKVKDRRFVLEAGEYQLIVAEKDGVRVATKEFKLTRGGKEIVNARLELAQARPKDDGKVKIAGGASLPNPAKSVLDALDPAKIPADERYGWQPKNLVAVLGSHRWRHWDSVVSVAISPDGRLVASAGAESQVSLREAATGKELATWKGNNVAFSPDGLILAVRDDTGVRLINSTTLKEQANFKLPDRIGHPSYQGGARLAFARDGKTLAAVSYLSDVRVWDVATGAERMALDKVMFGAYGGWSIALSADGGMLGLAGQVGGVKLWDVATRKELPAPPSEYQRALAISGDGRLLAAGGADHTLRLWDITAGKEVANLKRADQHVYAVAFTPNDQTLAVTWRDGSIRLWDVVKRTETDALLEHYSAVEAIAFSADGKTLVSGGRMDRTVRLWDMASKKQLNMIDGYPSRPDHLALTPDGRRLVVSGSSSGLETAMLWDVPAGALLKGWPTHSHVFHSAIFPDGKTLATTGHEGVRLWDLPSGGMLPPLRKSWTLRHAYSVRVSASGVLAATVPTQVDGEWFADVEIVNPGTRELKNSIRLGKQPTGYGSLMAISPDAALIAAQIEGAGIRVYDGASGHVRFEHTEPPGSPWLGSLAFSADGKTLLAATGGRGGVIRLWDAATGKLRQSYDNAHGGEGLACAAPLSDNTVISAGFDGTIFRWTAPGSGERLPKKTTLADFPGPVHQLALTADCRYLFTANGNGTVYVLRLGEPAPTAAKAETPPKIADPDRRAAEWALACGGNIVVRTVTGAHPKIAAAKDLPKDPFALVRVVLVGGGDRVTDQGLDNLAGLRHLTHLYLHKTAITDAGLDPIGQLTTLVDLSLPDTRITDTGLAKLKGLSALTQLSVYRTRVTDAGLAHIAALRELEIVDLNDQPITDAGLALLAKLPKLKNLGLAGAKITDRGLALLAKLPQLTTLDLGYTAITDAGMEHLKRITQLERLNISRTQVTESGVASIKDLPALWELGLSERQVTDAGLEPLRSLPKLATLKMVAELNDAHLERLRALPALTELHVQQPGMTAVFEDKLRKALPKCKVTVVR